MSVVRMQRWWRLNTYKSSLKGVSWGQHVVVDYKTRIYNFGNKLSLGNQVYLRSISKKYQAGMPFPTSILMDVKGAELSIGDNVRINGAYIHAQKHITIGKDTVIASGVNIMDSNGHELYSHNRKHVRDKPEPIRIGDNVWIGLNAIILKGTDIGDHSVVGAGSVVKGKFPPYSLIMGNPATLVKTLDPNRFDNQQQHKAVQQPIKS